MAVVPGSIVRVPLGAKYLALYDAGVTGAEIKAIPEACDAALGRRIAPICHWVALA